MGIMLAGEWAELLCTYHLVGEKQDSLEGELSVAKVEEVLERGTEKVDDHGIVVALLTVPSDEGNTDTTGEGLVDLGLVLKLRVLSLDGLELDGNLFTRDDVDTKVDVTERTGTNLLTDAVFAADTKIHDCCLDCGGLDAKGRCMKRLSLPERVAGWLTESVTMVKRKDGVGKPSEMKAMTNKAGVKIA